MVLKISLKIAEGGQKWEEERKWNEPTDLHLNRKWAAVRSGPGVRKPVRLACDSLVRCKERYELPVEQEARPRTALWLSTGSPTDSTNERSSCGYRRDISITKAQGACRCWCRCRVAPSDVVSRTSDVSRQRDTDHPNSIEVGAPLTPV